MKHHCILSLAFAFFVLNSLSGQNRIAYDSNGATHIIDLEQTIEILRPNEILKKEAFESRAQIINFADQLDVAPRFNSSWIFCNALISPHDGSYVYLQRDRMSAAFSLNYFNNQTQAYSKLFDYTNAPVKNLGFKPIAWSKDPDVIYLEAFVFDDALKHEGIWEYNIKTSTYKQLDIDPQSYTSTPILSPDGELFVYTSTSRLPKIQVHGVSDQIKIYDIKKAQSSVLLQTQSNLSILGWTYTDTSQLKVDRSTYTGWTQENLRQRANSISLYFPWESGIEYCVTRDGSDAVPGPPGAGSTGGYSCDLGSHDYPGAYDFDTPNNQDDKVLASASGQVVVANFAPGSGGFSPTGYGNWIVIEHSNTFRTLYAHLKSFNVALGDNVNTGCFIGIEGTTGGSSGDHIHFEYELPGGTSGNVYHEFADCGDCFCHAGYSYTSINVEQTNCEGCLPTLTLSGNIPSDTYEAEEYINATGTVSSTSNTVMTAGKAILWNTVMDIQPGAVLDAFIAPCTTSSISSTEETKTEIRNK